MKMEILVVLCVFAESFLTYSLFHFLGESIERLQKSPVRVASERSRQRR